MKNLFRVFVFIGIIASLSSCSKDYTCTCVDADGAETVTDLPGLSEEDAETACALLSIGGATCTVD